MASSMRLNIDQASLAALLRGPGGEVDTYLRRTAEKTAEYARQRAPRRTGRLAGNIIVSRGPMGSWDITANTSYALAVSQGMKAQKVHSKKPMSFPRKGGGPKVVVSAVNRPAISGNPFLMVSLRSAINSRV